jgi:hypothetical protein
MKRKRLLPVLALVATSALAGKLDFIAFKVVVLW